jgi:hypothetical protein
VLAARRQRFAILLAIDKQIALVAFQHRLGDFLWTLQTALVTPLDEVAQIELAAGDGARAVVLLGQVLEVAQQVVIEGVVQIADGRLWGDLAFFRHGSGDSSSG